MRRTVLVVGATGTQGGAVADSLLEADDFWVYALTRDPSSAAARALADRGASVVEGDLADRDSLETAMDGVDAVFLVTNYWEHGHDAEVVQGTTAAEVAAAAGVDLLVFSSVGNADRGTGIGHFESKYAIEQHIASLDLPATIVRPVYFMQNLERQRDTAPGGALELALHPGVSLPMIDITDLGRFVREVLRNPARYAGTATDLAGDELTLQAMAARIADVTGTDLDATHLSIEALRERRGDDESVRMYEWFNDDGYEVDLAGLRRDHDVDFTRLESYLGANGWGELD